MRIGGEIVSKEGKIIFPDMQMVLFSTSILKRNKNAKIFFDVKCSKILPEAIDKKEGIPIMSKTGHSYIKECMQQEKALLGGEMSGHIFFNDRWPGFDDGYMQEQDVRNYFKSKCGRRCL
ncbi:MAG: hypothetical protein Ct9H300mP3_09700 [Gammaproteobacteria bacterium]|nr:MAG: hypothetical protein Ct9H300mP3_09700 [Gammaproteobacteria bacterium]